MNSFNKKGDLAPRLDKIQAKIEKLKKKFLDASNWEGHVDMEVDTVPEQDKVGHSELELVECRLLGRNLNGSYGKVRSDIVKVLTENLSLWMVNL